MLVALTLAAAASLGHVQVDVLRVRSAPSLNAPVIGRLRKLTLVEMLEEKNGFVHIRYEARHEGFGGEPLDGYVKKELVGGPDPKPGEPAPATTHYIATCNAHDDGLRTELLGAIDASGAFHRLVTQISSSGSETTDSELENLVPKLATSLWWPVGIDQPSAFSGTAFPTARVRIVGGYGTDTALIDLGRCVVEGAMVSTSPLSVLPMVPSFKASQAARLAASVTSSELVGFDVFGVSGLTNVIARYETEDPNHGTMKYAQLCLADHDARPLEPRSCAGISVDAKPTWILLGDKRIAVFSEKYWTGYLSYAVIVVDENDHATVTQATIHSGGPGC